MKRTSITLTDEQEKALNAFKVFWENELGMNFKEAPILRKIIDLGIEQLKKQYRLP